jgi:hypothetical protein
LTSNGNNGSRAALVVAHPSHELRVHGWMQTARPHVFILTDGSGRAAEPRLQSTTKVMAGLGATAGSIYGRLTDLEVYEAFLSKNFARFIGLAEELADQFVRLRIEYAVTDADEGYSPTHDACRLLTSAAIELAKRRQSWEITNFDFAVVGPPDECPERDRDRAIWIRLDELAFSRKVAAVRTYDDKLAVEVEAALGGDLFRGVRRLSAPQLAGEVDTELNDQVVAQLNSYPRIEERFKGAFNGIELDRFRTECLRPVRAFAETPAARDETPFYELYGKKMVAAGHYQQTIRYAEHFRPLEEAMWSEVRDRVSGIACRGTKV